MAKFEINVGLHTYDREPSRVEMVARAQRVSTFCHYFFSDWQCRVDWDSPGEPTLVGSFSYYDDEHSRLAMVDALFALAGAEQQDCVALLYLDDEGGGELIGPAADGWGDFNIEYFRRW